MSKTKSMDDYIRETRSYALQFEASGFKKNAEFMYDLADYLKSLPTPAVADTNVGGKWIPCSERLPDDGENVLVWFEYFRYGHYNRLFQTTGISYVFDGEWSGFVNGSSGWSKLRIVAWMPLPEPYKGE